jgi:hypothetical protein
MDNRTGGIDNDDGGPHSVQFVFCVDHSLYGT